MKIRKTSRRSVLILIAPGFDEKLVVSSLSSLRETGIAVSLVGLTPGLIRSGHGLWVRADYALSELPPTVMPLLVFIPGNQQCAAALVSDPRVYQLLEKTLAQDGVVAVTPEIQPVLGRVGFTDSMTVHELLSRETMDSPEFVSRIVKPLAD